MTDKKERRKFDRALLDECMQRDGATLIGEYENIKCSTIIKFKCSCEKIIERKFVSMERWSGMFCKDCICKNRLENTKKTNLAKYGVENVYQAKEIKEKIKKINLEKYGAEHPMEVPEFKEKIKQTNLQKYGVEYASQTQEWKEKFKNTCIERYGCEAPQQNKEIRKKSLDTCFKNNGTEYPMQNLDILNKMLDNNIEKYGVKSTALIPEIKEKQKKTCIINYGVECPLQSTDIQNKIKQNNIKKYGVEYPCQSQVIQEKSQKNAKKFKPYKMPSGTIRKVQGYEPFALNCLVKTYTEEQIKTDRKDVPRIEYELESKKKYYFPDIFIPHENRLIEVKSCWTIKIKPEQIQSKAEASKAQGYKYEIWCFDAKGNRVEV